jgi:trk system potassium uptake protein TrkA
MTLTVEDPSDMVHHRRIVVAGGGRAGLETARQLSDRGHDVTVVERDSERCEQLVDEYLAVVIEGDATSPSILREADVESADAVAALTDDAETNLEVCLQAHRIAPSIQTLARTTTQEDGEDADLVDAVILPQHEAARTAVDLLSGGAVRTLVSGEELDILEIEVSSSAPVEGRTLAEVSLPRGALVVSDAGRTRLASGETELTAGDRYLVAAESDVAEEVQLLFRG